MSMKARLAPNWIFLHLTSPSNKSSSSPEMWAELSQRTNHRRCTRGVEKTKPSHRLTNYKIYNEKTEDFGTPAADVGSVSRNANETEIHRPKAHSFQKVWQSYFAHKAEWFRVWVQLSLHNVCMFKDLLKKGQMFMSACYKTVSLSSGLLYSGQSLVKIVITPFTAQRSCNITRTFTEP